jgi:hypothetical protein
MAALAQYKETRIADGDVTGALRTMIEGIAIGKGGYYDANPGTDTLTTYEGRPNLLADDDLVFYQKDPKGSVITGLSDESLYYIVNTNGLSMQVSATQGGQPIVLGSADKGVFTKVLVDYRQSQGTEILLAATYFVDPDDGSDSNAGTSAGAAWATIGKALGATGVASTAVANTIYLKPARYREAVVISWTNPTALQTVIGDYNDEQAWTSARSHPFVEWTGYTTNDQSQGDANDTLDMAGLDFVKFQDIRFVGSDYEVSLIDAQASGAAWSSNITFKRCEFIGPFDSTLGGSGWAIRFSQSTTSVAAINWLIEDCVVWCCSGAFQFNMQPDGVGYDMGLTIRRCLFALGDGDVIEFNHAAGAGPAGGAQIYDCTCMGAGHRAFVVCPDANFSTSNAVDVENCVIYGGGAAGPLLEAFSSGQIVSDYNVILGNSPFQNVTKGGNDVSKTGTPDYRSPGTIVGAAPWLWDMPLKRFPFEMFPWGSHIGEGASVNFDATADIFGRPRPGSGDPSETPGCLELPLVEQETGLNFSPHSGGSCWLVNGTGVFDLPIPVPALSTTISVWVYRATSLYTLGTRPSVSILANPEVGVSGQTVTGTAACDNDWEQLTFTAISPTRPARIVLRFENGSSSKGGLCGFDDIDYSF